MATPDERKEALLEGIGRMPRQLALVGEYHFSPEYRPMPVESDRDSGILYVGCRACLDASPWHLYIAAVSDGGFWGLWRDYQTGIGRAFDEAGHPLPDPAGLFCAKRVSGP